MSDRSFPYPSNEGQTHHFDCWKLKKHHNCCVARVYQLQDEVDSIRAELQASEQEKLALAVEIGNLKRMLKS